MELRNIDIESHATVHITHHVHSCTEPVNLTIVARDHASCTLDVYGEGTVTINITVTLFDYAQVIIRAAYISDSSHKATFNVNYHHAAAYATSSFLLKGFLCDSAQSHYAGMVTVSPLAKGTDAEQKHHALTYGAATSSYSVPQMEVLNHAVRCAHGTALGTIDQNALLYLRLRGLSEQTAYFLLLNAFFKDHFTDHTLDSAINKKLNTLITRLYDATNL